MAETHRAPSQRLFGWENQVGMVELADTQGLSPCEL